ncbi:hypothetical protein RQP46_004076 [Phenoliferia psychrophenolica]
MAGQTGAVTTTNAQGQTIVTDNQSAASAAAASLSSLVSSRATALSGRNQASALASEASVLATGGVITTTGANGQAITLSGTAAASSLASSASALTATRTGAPLATGEPTGTAGANGSEDRSSSSKGGIIGGAVGGVLGLLLLLGLLFWCFKRRSGKKGDKRHESFFSPGAAYEEYPPSPTFQGFPVSFDANAQQSAASASQYNLFPARTGPAPPMPTASQQGALPHSQRSSGGSLSGYAPIVRPGFPTSRQAEAYPAQSSLMFPANLKAPQTIRAVHATSYSTSSALSAGSSILEVGPSQSRPRPLSSGSSGRPRPLSQATSSNGSEHGTPTTIRAFVAANVAARLANASASSAAYAALPIPPSPTRSSHSEIDPFRRGSPNFADQLMQEHRVSVDTNRSNDSSDESGWVPPPVTVYSASIGAMPTLPFQQKPEGLPEPTLNTAWSSTRVGSIFPNIAPPKPIVLRQSQHQGGQDPSSTVTESPTIPWSSSSIMYPAAMSAGNSGNPSSVSLDSFATALSGRTPAESVAEDTLRHSIDSTYSDDNVEDLHATYDASEDPFEDSNTPRESLQSLQSISSTSTLRGPIMNDLHAARGSLAPSQVDTRESTATVLNYLAGYERPASRNP